MPLCKVNQKGSRPTFATPYLFLSHLDAFILQGLSLSAGQNSMNRKKGKMSACVTLLMSEI